MRENFYGKKYDRLRQSCRKHTDKKHNSKKITDIFDGYRDVNRKKIKFTNSPKLRLLDNPLNSLKAIKLVSELGFNIDYKTFKAIKKSKALKNLSLEEMLPTIDQILEGEYLKNALFYLANTKLYKDISPVELLRMCGEYYDVKKDELDKRIESIIKRFDMERKNLNELCN